MTDKETRKKQITARRQEQILKAALEVFARKGFAAATIPEIARSAGVATGTIYLYFPGKRELFTAAIENVIASPLVHIFEKDSHLEFNVPLKEAIENRLRMLQVNMPTLLLPLIGDIMRDPELREHLIEAVIRPLLNRMEQLYGNRINTGEFRNFEPTLLVRMIGGMVVGLSLIRLMEGPSGPLEKLSQGQLGDEVMNFILHGLMNKREKNHECKRDQP